MGLVGGDNLLLLLSASLLVGRFVEAFPLAIVVGAAMLTHTVASMNRYLQEVARAEI